MLSLTAANKTEISKVQFIFAARLKLSNSKIGYRFMTTTMHVARTVLN